MLLETPTCMSICIGKITLVKVSRKIQARGPSPHSLSMWAVLTILPLYPNLLALIAAKVPTWKWELMIFYSVLKTELVSCGEFIFASGLFPSINTKGIERERSSERISRSISDSKRFKQASLTWMPSFLKAFVSSNPNLSLPPLWFPKSNPLMSWRTLISGSTISIRSCQQSLI